MKYIKVSSTDYAEYNPVSAALAGITANPESQGVVFYSKTDAGVVAYLAAQTEAAKPKAVKMRQARLALLQGGFLGKVASAIKSMPSPQKEAAEIEWEYSDLLVRSHPLVAQLGVALGLDDGGLDALFLKASKL